MRVGIGASISYTLCMGDGQSQESGSAAGDKKPLFVACTSSDGVVFAKLVGPSIGSREAPIIATAVLDACESPENPARAVVLDFKDVAFMNSTGLGMCVEIQSAAAHHGGKTILYRLSEQLLSILKMTRMDQLYTIAADSKQLEKALQR